MRVLLDTHTLLWILFNPTNIDEKVIDIVTNYKNDICVSVVSLWEIEIKHLKRPDTMPYSAKEIKSAIEKAGFRLFPIRSEHIDKLSFIIEQKIHQDPFDHLLLSTSLYEQCALLTHDKEVRNYRGVMIIDY